LGGNRKEYKKVIKKTAGGGARDKAIQRKRKWGLEKKQKVEKTNAAVEDPAGRALILR